MNQKPVLAITMGDPAGIGPEVTMKALSHPRIFDACLPVVIGDGEALRQTAEMLGSDVKLHPVMGPEGACGCSGTLDYIDMKKLSPGSWEMGKVSALAGEAAFSYVEEGIRMAMECKVDAVVTAPINKEAINLAGHHYSGHTEIFSHYTGTRDYGMLLVSPTLRVIHVTTHMSMRDVCDALTTPRVLQTIKLADFALKLMGLDGGKIAVAGFNAHCSENGLFGTEEHDAIIPAVQEAQALGITVEGPIPPDTVFVKAAAGAYQIVVAMYHDQGHIPLKLSGFRIDPASGRFSSVSGINCTIGLPIIRTSVDHGTAFDRAGLGNANEESMMDAIDMAVTMAEKLDLIRNRKNTGGPL